MVPSDLNLHAARDLDMRQHRQGRKQPLDHHPHIGARIRRGDQHEAVALVHMAAHGGRGLGAELLDQARIDVEFDHIALIVALQRLMERQVPAIAQPQHFQHAIIGEIAANLLRHAHAHMLGELLGAADMRSDFGDRLQDEMQIADRNALGQAAASARPEGRR